jgi:hypothetical protein
MSIEPSAFAVASNISKHIRAVAKPAPTRPHDRCPTLTPEARLRASQMIGSTMDCIVRPHRLPHQPPAVVKNATDGLQQQSFLFGGFVLDGRVARTGRGLIEHAGAACGAMPWVYAEA